MITHVSGTVMYVADQDASRAFYVDKLGFRVVRDEEMWPGARWRSSMAPREAGATTRPPRISLAKLLQMEAIWCCSSTI